MKKIIFFVFALFLISSVSGQLPDGNFRYIRATSLMTVSNHITAAHLVFSSPTTGKMYASDSIPSWIYVPIGIDTSHFWNIAGNAGTNSLINFIGTTDTMDLVFKTYNLESGRLSWNSNVANTFFGTFTGAAITSGANNTFVGYTAGNQTTSGSFNTFVGQNSGLGIITGSNNVMIGRLTGQYGEGSNSICIGNFAGMQTTNLTNKIFINSQNWGTEKKDSTQSPFYAYMGNDSSAHRIRLNGNTYIGSGWKLPFSDGTIGQTIITNGANVATWGNISTYAWSLTGNAGTVAGTNFIGTTDNVALNFRVNNQKAGSIDNTNANVFLGYQSGNNILGGINNTFIGHEAGYADSTGGYSVLMGYHSGYLYKTGYYNVGIGYGAMASGVQCDGVIAIGGLAMNLATGSAVANNDIAIGYKALYQSTMAHNVAIGANCLSLSPNGQANVAIGEDALANSNSDNNVVIGCWAFKKNGTTTSAWHSSGEQNVVVGDLAGYENLTAQENTILGSESMRYFQFGVNNVAIGRKAGYGLVGHTKNYDVYVGYMAGYSDTSDNNTYIGYRAGYGNTLGTNNIAIGYYAGEYLLQQSNRLFLNSIDRGDSLSDQSKSIIYGEQNDDSSAQNLYFNANTHLGSYVDGYMMPFLDGTPGQYITTNGLGVTSWGTITSVWSIEDSVMYPTDTTNHVEIGKTDLQGTELFGVYNGSVLFGGTTGETPISGAGTRFMWIPAKGAFRAGVVTGAQWDDANVGTNSISIGLDNIAASVYSTAFGKENTINASALESFAVGYANTITGINANIPLYAIGYGNTITDPVGSTSGALGYQNICATGHAVGLLNNITGTTRPSIGLGMGNVVNCNAGNAIGYYTNTTADYAFTNGYYTTNQSYNSAVFGRYNVPIGTPGSWVLTDPLFNIGNGDSLAPKSNDAFKILKNGDTYIADGAYNTDPIMTIKASDSIIIINGLNCDIRVVSLDSSQQYVPATGISGRGWLSVDDGTTASEWADFKFDDDGTVTLIQNSANIVTTSTAGKLCIIDNGSGIAMLNRLVGAAKAIKLRLEY